MVARVGKISWTAFSKCFVWCCWRPLQENRPVNVGTGCVCVWYLVSPTVCLRSVELALWTAAAAIVEGMNSFPETAIWSQGTSCEQFTTHKCQPGGRGAETLVALPLGLTVRHVQNPVTPTFHPLSLTCSFGHLSQASKTPCLSSE